MDLKKLREEIQKADKKIIEDLNKRAQVMEKIKTLKEKEGRPLYDPVQFSQVKERLHSLNKGPLANEVIDNIYHEIHSAMLNIETNLKVAFVASGPESYEAAHTEFGSSVDLRARKSVNEVLQEVKKKKFDYGVVPLNGNPNKVLDKIAKEELNIIQGIQLKAKRNGKKKILSYVVICSR